jgi:hypothetical protein
MDCLREACKDREVRGQHQQGLPNRPCSLGNVVAISQEEFWLILPAVGGKWVLVGSRSVFGLLPQAATGLFLGVWFGQTGYSTLLVHPVEIRDAIR